MLSSENQRDNWLQYSSKRGLPENNFDISEGTHHAPVQYTFAQRYDGAYRAELDHIIEILDKGHEVCRIAAADSILVGFYADACEKSWKTGQKISVDDFVRERSKIEIGVELGVHDFKNRFDQITKI